MGWQNGGKMTQKGGKMATFAGTCYVTGYGATPLLSRGYVNCRQMSAERQLATIIYKSRTCVEKLVSQNLEKPENVAFRSISRMQSGPHSGSLPEGSPGRSRRGERSTGQAGSRLRDKLDVQGIRHGSTPGSSRVRRAGWLGSSWPQRASPQRQPRIWGRRPSGVDPSHP